MPVRRPDWYRFVNRRGTGVVPPAFTPTRSGATSRWRSIATTCSPATTTVARSARKPCWSASI